MAMPSLTHFDAKKNNRRNFSGGPGVLPQSVLETLQEALIAVPEAGLSLLGISHRSDWFSAVIAELEQNFRDLLALPAHYHPLFLQGGATQQFAQIPLHLSKKGKFADYLHTGYWSGKAITEAQKFTPVNILWSGEKEGFRRLPETNALHHTEDAAFFHYVSNETVEGLQYHEIPGHDAVPRVCDMSSDLLCRPIVDIERFALIYAHAQKNLGPAGVTVILIDDKTAGRVRDDLPLCLDYRTHMDAHSIYNTPPVFAIYATLLVTRWLKNEIGGLALMEKINQEKAALLYRVIDENPSLYRPQVDVANRSLMNVVFHLRTPEESRKFVEDAEKAGFFGLDGHRSLGGVRASIYNAMPLESVAELAHFMSDYR